MIHLLGLALALQAPIEQPPRLRTLLPNGALILVERVPHAKSLTVDLFVSSRGTEDTPTTHGRRHLLEHLVALGPDGALDTRLETAGGFMTARTWRESTEFEIALPPDAMSQGVKTLRELLSKPMIDSDAIARETHIIEEEGALRDDASRASEAAWNTAFGVGGLDPYGNLDIMRATKPEELEALRTRSFAANHLAVVVSGDVGLDSATSAISAVLKPIAAIPDDKERMRLVYQNGSTDAAIRGNFRAVSVSGYRAPQTAATLAAALAMSYSIPGGEVIYTPAAHQGLVLVGSALGGLKREMDRANAPQLFTIGRLAAIRWVVSRMNEPQTCASYRGMLLVSERDLKPETMLENLNALKYADFKAAIDEFKSSCVVVEGTR